jgi:hypothetical protein
VIYNAEVALLMMVLQWVQHSLTFLYQRTQGVGGFRLRL